MELHEDERSSLEMSDEEIHNLLPTALQRHADENRDDVLPGEEYQDVTWTLPCACTRRTSARERRDHGCRRDPRRDVLRDVFASRARP